MSVPPQGGRYGALPVSGGRLLLHSCCAPCSCDIMAGLKDSGIDFAVFFYNPNIHPQAEYERRKDENKKACQKLGVPFIDADYDVGEWAARVKGLEDEPERGKRCTICFAMRMERTALYASENGFSVFATTLGLSRHKNQEQVYGCGSVAAARYEGLAFWPVNWRAGGGVQRADALAREAGFYRQDYCGCAYSLRDAQKRRAAKEPEAE